VRVKSVRSLKRSGTLQSDWPLSVLTELQGAKSRAPAGHKGPLRTIRSSIRRPIKEHPETRLFGVFSLGFAVWCRYEICTETLYSGMYRPPPRPCSTVYFFLPPPASSIHLTFRPFYEFPLCWGCSKIHIHALSLFAFTCLIVNTICS
jgi:hypothetical protein